VAYSDAEKAEALIKLAVNFYNFEKTSDELGVAQSTLRAWDKKSAEIAQKKDRFDTAELLERAVQRLLMTIPKPVTLQEWAVTVGILMDKVALFQGMPTQRTESIVRTLQELQDDEFANVLAEAERILAETTSGGGNNGHKSGA